jgi:hypothetical protein
MSFKYWHPKTVEELVDALAKQMLRPNQSGEAHALKHEWTLSFIRVYQDRVDTGLSRKELTIVRAFPDGDYAKEGVLQEKLLTRGGPGGRLTRIRTGFLKDCDPEARALLRQKLVDAGVKLIPSTDNPKLD